MSERGEGSGPPGGSTAREASARLRRHGRLLFDLALLPALALWAVTVLGWRAESLSGYGLRREIAGAGAAGAATMATVDPFVAADGVAMGAAAVRRRWSGTLVTPRSGLHHFVVVVQDGAARVTLHLDGRALVPSRSSQAGRRAFCTPLVAGGHALALDYRGSARGGSRFFWSPARPGAALEVVPPTLLFPSAAGPSSALPAYAIAPADAQSCGLLATAALAVVLLWLRRTLFRGLVLLRAAGWARLDAILTLGLFAAALGIRLWDLDALGPTIGEAPLAARGQNVLHLLLAGRFDALSWVWASGQPGLGAAWFGAAGALATGLLGGGRELTALAGALTCALLFLLGRDSVGRGVGLLAAALAIVLPPLWGHDRLLAAATPAALFYLLSMWCFLHGMRLGLAAGVGPALEEQPPAPLAGSGYFVWAGLAAGLAIAVEPASLSLLVAQVVLFALVGLRRRGAPALALPPSLALAPLALLGVFVALHPPLWHAPAHELGSWLLTLGAPVEPEVFFGALHSVPPWSYAPSYLVAVLPAGVAVAATLGVLRVLWRREVGGWAALVWLGAVLLPGLGAPVGGAQAVLPALPVACLLAAAGVDGISRAIVRPLHRPAWRLPLTALLGAGLTVYTLLAGAAVHPYQLDYYSEFFGGTEGAARDETFVIAWRGEGLDEALAYVARQAPRGASVRLDVRRPERARPRADLRVVSASAAAGTSPDFVVRDRSARGAPPAGYRRTFAVRAGRAALLYVYRK